MYNIGFKPIFQTETERENFINAQPDLFPTFDEWYWDNMKRHNTMIEKMKWYIYKNWEKLTLTDWNNINFVINKQKYGHKFDLTRRKLKPNEHHSEILNKIMKNYNSKVKTITMIGFVYDETDGDLSVNINDKDNWKFLDDEEINDIALHIERTLTDIK